jgi:hypothetical protein
MSKPSQHATRSSSKRRNGEKTKRRPLTQKSEKRCLTEIADAEKRKAELEAKIGRPFEHEDKLQSLT